MLVRRQLQPWDAKRSDNGQAQKGCIDVLLSAAHALQQLLRARWRIEQISCKLL